MPLLSEGELPATAVFLGGMRKQIPRRTNVLLGMTRATRARTAAVVEVNSGNVYVSQTGVITAGYSYS
jgi:hypothetical protein